MYYFPSPKIIPWLKGMLCFGDRYIGRQRSTLEKEQNPIILALKKKKKNQMHKFATSDSGMP